MDIRQCNLCGGRQGSLVLASNGYDIVRCEKCSLVYVNQEFTEDDLKEFYAEGYYTGQYEQTYRDYFNEGEKRIRSARNKVDQLLRYAAGGRLLEIGCAAGYFLQAARGEFEVRGVELSDCASRFARQTYGLEVQTGSVFEAAYEQESFDVVVMIDVIEHLIDPKGTLQEVRRILRAGGILVVSTGDISSRMARRDLAGWGLMAPPWHLYYFSRKTLKSLLDEVGFAVLDRRTNGIFTVTSNRVINNRYTRYLAARLGCGDIMTWYCHKVACRDGQFDAGAVG